MKTNGKVPEDIRGDIGQCSVLCVCKVRRLCTRVSRPGSGKGAGLETGRRPAFGEFIAVTEEGGGPSAAFSPLQVKRDTGVVGKSHIIPLDKDPLPSWQSHRREACEMARWQLPGTGS